MRWTIRFDQKAKKELDKIPLNFRKRIFGAIPLLATNPYIGKKLDGELSGFYSYRVWPYRIVYKIYHQQLIILLVRIAHRQGVYK